MRIKFDYDIDNISDITLVLESIKDSLNRQNAQITNANIYLSLKNKDNKPVELCNKDGNKIKYVVKKKFYKNRNTVSCYAICDDNKNPIVYVYKQIDNSK